MFNRSEDRSSLCSFTFVDGRHCRISPPGRPSLSLRLSVVVAGLQTRQGDGRERPVSSRGQRGICFLPLYLGQTLVQILPLAQDEYINAYNTNSWRETIRTSHDQSANHVVRSPIAASAAESRACVTPLVAIE